MKSAKKTWLLMLVVVLMAVSVLTACGGNNNAGEPAPEGTTGEGGEQVAGTAWELGSESLDFTFYGHYDWYTMPEWGADDSSAWIKENKKVNITAVHSGGNAAQKFNTMIAANDLPDVMWMERGADVEKLRAAGMLVAFDEYLGKYPNLKEWLGEAGLNMLRSSDGKIYQFPNWYTSQPNGNAGYVVNKKIYEELGSPKLETTEDLYNYLTMVKEKYPNVIPFEPGLAIDGQGLSVLTSAFAEEWSTTQIGVLGVKNGDKLTSIFTDPTYREGMLFASKLFREKLMSQDALTQTSDQITEKVVSGRVAVFASASPTELGMKGHIELIKNDPNAGYFMIWPIHKEGLDKNKIMAGTYGQLGWNVSVITKAAEDPEKIFAFLDWYTGPEGQRVLMWGPEGKYWNGVEEDGTPKYTEAYVSDSAGLIDLQSKTVNLMWNGNTVYVDRAKAKFESKLPVEQRNWATNYQYEITWKTQMDATEFTNLNPSPDSEEGIIEQRVDDIYTEAAAKVLFAKSDEEGNAILDQAEKDAQDAGYAKLLEYKTVKWQENLANMNGQ